MKVEQIYTGCLAQGAYYVESNGEAAIIDPIREVNEYLDLAKSRNTRIKYVFETHFHADFVSGHLTLSEKTGAPIIFGPNAVTDFDCINAKDQQEFKIGNITMRVLHTPGHTMESSCFLLIDEKGLEHALFSGDTLFIGDVGRPDLAVKSNLTKEDLAASLYDSLRNKIMPLNDHVIVYPGHGAGSACGKNISSELESTIGKQKKSNYALRADMTKEEFVKEVLDGISAPPAYFPLNVQLNKGGYENIDEVLERGNRGYSPDEFEQIASSTSVLVLDVRHQDDFAKGHVPNSIFIGLNGGFAPWVGTIIKDVNQKLLIVCEDSQINEAITRLSRVGFDNVLGFLKGGFSSWVGQQKTIAKVDSISAEAFGLLSASQHINVMDVRKENEHISEHVINAKNTPLNSLEENLKSYQDGELKYVHCAGGYRSMIACSLLKRHGIQNIVDVRGGFSAIKDSKAPISEFVCPSTL